MPILPDTGPRTTLQPSTEIAQYQGDQVGRATENLGGSMISTADQVTDISNRIAEQHAQDALVQLKRQQNQLIVGEDGYAHLQNGAATADGVFPKYQGLQKAAVEQIGSQLGDQAKSIFDHHAQDYTTNFLGGLMTHQMREDLAHQGEVYNAQVAAGAESAGIGYNNEVVLRRELADAGTNTARYIKQQGITEPALQERYLQSALGQIHMAAIQGWLNSNDPENATRANDYFKSIKQEMLPEQAKTMENILRPELANQDGRNIATEMFNMKQQGKSELQIHSYMMDKTAKSGMDSMRVAKSLYGDMLNAKEADQRNTEGSILLSAMNGEKGSGVTDKRISYLEPGRQVIVRKQMEALMNKGTGDAGDGGAKKSNMPLFADLSQRIGDGDPNMTKAFIVSHAGQLTTGDMKVLMNQIDEANTKAGKYKIDPGIIANVIPKNATEAETKAIKGEIARNRLLWQQANPGQIPSYEQANRIVAQSLENHVNPNSGGFFNTVFNAITFGAVDHSGTEIPAYKAELGTAYPKSYETNPVLQGVDKAALPDAYKFVTEWYMQKRKSDPNYSLNELLQKWKADYEYKQSKGN